MKQTRREFLTDVGKGVLAAGLGPALMADLGLGKVLAAEGSDTLSFGKLEPLVALMQETPADKLLPILVDKLRGGTGLDELLAGAALANARTFGGEDYVGFHTMMALAPSFHMSRELPEKSRPLPVLKVLHRNANRIQAFGGRKKEVLRVVEPKAPEGKKPGEVILDAVHRKDFNTAEQTFAAAARNGSTTALNELLTAVEDCLDVHRVVLPYRAWDLLPIVGTEHAHTLLRQSVRYCVKNDSPNYRNHYNGARAVLPKLIDQHKLFAKKLGDKTGDDAWVEKLSMTIFGSKPDEAAGAVAEALAEGFSPTVIGEALALATNQLIGEALALATNQLILRDEGRPKQEAPNKPAGSVHGDGIGVHACDSANAWRNLARAAHAQHTIACLILGAWQASFDRGDRGGNFLKWEPYPRPDHPRPKTNDAAALLKETEDAIKSNDQVRACAAVAAYGGAGHAPRPVFDLLLRFAISEDGALHAEKYYRTASEEFAAARPAFRWRHVVSLARVTASEYGQPAPGHADSCRLLGIS
jgi:hypothetical protein